ncbi:MAG: ParB N-terminal domain-containing protein [Clostridia bacterium]|nr:ParB N-terminal domain-containing protein [Clostridia bacterium]
MKKLLQMIKVQRKMKLQRQERALDLTKQRLQVLKEHYTVHLIPLERISLPDLHRTPPDERSLKALCDSIYRYGLLEPLVVRRISQDDSSFGGVFNLVAGEKRYRALKQLGMEKAPCVICDLQAVTLLPAVASLLFCKQPVDIYEKAAILHALQAQTAVNNEQLCKICGITQKELAELSLIADLEEDERALCRSSALPRYLAREIAAIPSGKERKRVLVECVHTLRTIFPAQRETDAPGSRRLLFSDIRPFYNSIEEMARRIRQGGIEAETHKAEDEDYFEITLRIAKNSVHRVTYDSTPRADG